MGWTFKREFTFLVFQSSKQTHMGVCVCVGNVNKNFVSYDFKLEGQVPMVVSVSWPKYALISSAHPESSHRL